VPIVKNENMTVVWATRIHLMLPFARSTGLSNAPMHWKNRATTTPRMINRTDEVSTDSGPVGRRTIEYRTEEIPGEIGLLPKVNPYGICGALGLLDQRAQRFARTWSGQVCSNHLY
jgi:hypothetical protein